MNNTPNTACCSSEMVGAMSFCSVWPMARALLSGVLPSVGNANLRLAIEALMAAANAVCSPAAAAQLRLEQFGLKAPAGPAAFLSGLSDNELQVLAQVQRNAEQRGVATADDVGGGIF